MCTNPLIIVYDKGGTVEVYGECFKLLEHSLPVLGNLIGQFQGTKSLSCPQLRSRQLSCPLLSSPLLICTLLSSKLVRR